MDKKTQAELLVLEVLNSNGKISRTELFKEIRRIQEERKLNLWKFKDVGGIIVTKGNGVPRLEDVVFGLFFVDYIRFCESKLMGMAFEDYYEITQAGREYLLAGGDLKLLSLQLRSRR